MISNDKILEICEHAVSVEHITVEKFIAIRMLALFAETHQWPLLPYYDNLVRVGL